MTEDKVINPEVDITDEFVKYINEHKEDVQFEFYVDKNFPFTKTIKLDAVIRSFDFKRAVEHINHYWKDSMIVIKKCIWAEDTEYFRKMYKEEGWIYEKRVFMYCRIIKKENEIKDFKNDKWYGKKIKTKDLKIGEVFLFIDTDAWTFHGPYYKVIEKDEEKKEIIYKKYDPENTEEFPEKKVEFEKIVNIRPFAYKFIHNMYPRNKNCYKYWPYDENGEFCDPPKDYSNYKGEKND